MHVRLGYCSYFIDALHLDSIEYFQTIIIVVLRKLFYHTH